VRLCRMFTAVAFLVHLIVGCCAHHAHACGVKGHCIPTPGAASPIEPCPDHSGSPADQGQPGSHGCQGVSCSFIRTANDSLSGPLLQIYPIPVVPWSDVGNLLSGNSFLGQFLAFSPDGPSPPVRRHLFLQILLI
jgi:hypothetical protein